MFDFMSTKNMILDTFVSGMNQLETQLQFTLPLRDLTQVGNLISKGTKTGFGKPLKQRSLMVYRKIN